MSLDYEVYKEGGVLNERYQKIEDISEGSYGYVSLAKDIKEKKLVAIKYIFKLDHESEAKDEASGSDEEDGHASHNDGNTSSQEKKTQLQRFKSKISSNVKSRLSNNICFEAIYEIDIQTKLGNDNNNIVKLLNYFDSYIVLEYCSGGDLYEAIKSDLVPRKTKKIKHILNQIIDAIKFMHSKNIYHRDLKPENILISNLFEWTIKISDFGLATTELTSLDRNVGSERYMAPELFESNLDLQERKEPYRCDKVDVWSMGIVFLNIVFSKNPFSVANQSDKSFCYFAANREALFDVFSTMSLDFFQVLRYTLTIDPTNRDLQRMKFEITNLNSFTLDDEYFNSLDDDDIAISDEDFKEQEQQQQQQQQNEAKQPLSYIPPSSAPMPVSLPTPISSSIKENSKKKIHLQHSSIPVDIKDDDLSIISSNLNPTGNTTEDKQRAKSVPKSVPKFKFQKRSHLQKNNNNNSNLNTYNNSNKNHNNRNFGTSIKSYNHQNNYFFNNNYNNNYNRNHYIDNPKIIKHSRKPLGIPTPNTHINNFFQNYQENAESNNHNNRFNTRDFFTPPSVHNKYMEGFLNHDQNHNYSNHSHKYNGRNKNFIGNSSGKQRKSTGSNGNINNSTERLLVPKNKHSPSSIANSNSNPNSIPNSISSQHSPGKYIPPNARTNYGNQFLSNSPNVPDISTVLNGPTTFHEQYTNMDSTNVNNGAANGNVDLDDVLFTLEENEYDFIHDINNLSLNDQPVHVNSIDSNIVRSTTRNDLPDLLKSPVTKEQHLFTNEINPFGNQLLHSNENTKSPSAKLSFSVSKHKPGIYVPPHHRKNSSSIPNNTNEATLSVANNSLNYSTSFNSKPSSENVEPSRSFQRSFLAPISNHSTTTTAVQDNDIFAHTNNDALFFSDDDSEGINSPDAKSMFGPYEIYNNNKNILSHFRGGRKSSTVPDDVVGSLEQYKNNWLMLQQQQE